MQWKEIACGFEEQWNFPRCIGALDGKHVTINSPRHGGSYFSNNKGPQSIVLLALVDPNYKFFFVDIACNGRVSDEGYFGSTSLATGIRNKKLVLPSPWPLPDRQVKVPYVIVADDAFPLQENIMKPHPYKNKDTVSRVFNYRLSRARRVVESAFGILATRFRVLLKPINLNLDKAQLIVQAIVVLHNFLLKRSPQVYTPPGTVDYEDQSGNVTLGSWRNDFNPYETLQNMTQQSSNHSSRLAKKIQREYAEYFVSKSGEVSWQYQRV